jgi:EAL domain-containing protein (putative c-di-GMP-specific phosphodiesterase class I)
VWVGEDEIFARPAIGIAVFPAHGADEVVLLRRARTACQATRGTPERVAVYAEEQERQGAESLLYDNRLRAAVSQEGLEQVFQPIVEFRTGLVAGAESLLRWRDHDGILVAIDAALDAAESAGRAEDLASWLLSGALRTCSELRQSGGLDIRIGVNLSAKSLRDDGFPDLVSRLLRTWGLRPSRLSFEISGTALLAHSEPARETLKRLRSLGVRLAIDDLGAGIESLAALAALPFDELKLDLAALPGLPEPAAHAALAQSLIELAHRLKFEVVACGVDADPAIACLKQLGCDYLQGAKVSPPLDPVSFVQKFGIDNR